MAIPNPKILDANLSELTAPLTFDGLPGARSNVETLYIINNPGGAGAEPLRDHVLRVLERAAGETVWQGSGRPLVEGRRVEARILGGIGGLEVDPTAWEPLGSGRPLEIPELGNGQGIQLELSLVLPIDTVAGQTELYFGLSDQRATALERGHSEASGDGIYLGLGDGLTTELVHGGVVTVHEPADDQVDVSGTGWIATGEPFYIPPSTLQLDAVDGVGVELAAGTAYFALLTLDATGTLLVIKSEQAPEPLPEALRPAVPTGAIALVMIQRDDSGLITQGDVEPLATAGAASWSSEGLTAQIGPSRALVDNRWIVHRVGETVSLPPNSNVEVWRLPQGDIAVTADGSRPDPRALLLHEAETDAAAVVVHRPRRRFLGRQVVLQFSVDAVVGAMSDPVVWPFEVSGRVAPIPGSLTLYALPQGGSVSGATRLDLEVWRDGEWSSMFPSGDLPQVLFNGENDVRKLPEVLNLPPRSLLHVVLIDLPDVAPSMVTVSLVCNC